jgi:prevent-host-death family protein
MSTQRVNLAQAKDQISDLINTASKGGEVIIEENGKALVRIIPATDAAAYQSQPTATSEFSSDEDSLAWDAAGWENVA